MGFLLGFLFGELSLAPLSLSLSLSLLFSFPFQSSQRALRSTLLPPRPESAFSLCLPKPCCSLGWSTRPETARVSSAKARLFSSSASAVQRARGSTRHAPTRTRGPKRHARHQARKLGEVKALQGQTKKAMDKSIYLCLSLFLYLFLSISPAISISVS